MEEMEEMGHSQLSVSQSVSQVSGVSQSVPRPAESVNGDMQLCAV